MLVLCIVEHAPHVGWVFDCFDDFMFETWRVQGMRLYHQPGLSNRVVSALRNRLERVLLGMSADGDARAHGNGSSWGRR